MKQSKLDMLRYEQASIAASENTSPRLRGFADTIMELLDLVQFYQDELDRVRAKYDGESNAT